MENEKDELLQELVVIHALIDENPCRMSRGVMRTIAAGIKFIVGSHIDGGASREQAAKYLQRDVRTLTRWKSEYPDFPNARQIGHKESIYAWKDLVRFKLAHKELYK